MNFVTQARTSFRISDFGFRIFRPPIRGLNGYTVERLYGPPTRPVTSHQTNLRSVCIEYRVSSIEYRVSRIEL